MAPYHTRIIPTAETSKLAGLTAIRDKALLGFFLFFGFSFVLLVGLEDVCAYVVTEN